MKLALMLHQPTGGPLPDFAVEITTPTMREACRGYYQQVRQTGLYSVFCVTAPASEPLDFGVSYEARNGLNLKSGIGNVLIMPFAPSP